MTKQEILEYNKLCAEFLGAYWCNDDLNSYPNGYWIINNHEFELPYNLEDMEFHSDWNWIMEVRNKILSINSYSSSGQRFIFNMNATAKYRKNENDKPYKVRIKGVSISYPLPFVEVNSFDEKEAVVQAINQFLIWYNKNK